MSDIRLKSSYDYFDIDLENTSIDSRDSIRNAVIISLLSDSRDNNERGFWGDQLEEGLVTGSRLWTVGREKTLSQTREALEDFARECLVWMTDEGLAQEIEVQSEIKNSKRIDLKINISRPEGNESFDFLWNGEELRDGISET